MNDELLISLVEEASHLYDRSLKDYKDDLIKENTWISIASYLNSTLKKRWENLRYRFVRCYREFYEKLPSGSGVLNKKIDFPYFETMKWVAPFIRKRKLTSSVKILPSVTKPQEHTSTPDKYVLHVTEEELTYDIASDEVLSPLPYSEGSTSQAQLDSPPSRPASAQACPENTQSRPGSSQSGEVSQPKRSLLHDNMTRALESFNKLCEDKQHTSKSSSDMNFMSSVVEDMQLLTTNKKIKFKRDVMELLIKYIEEDD